MNTVLITGATGLLGRALSHHLETEGWNIRSLIRSPGGSQTWQWDPAGGDLPEEALIGADAVVHLAGESLIGRWTAAKRRRILDSRVQSTALLAKKMASLEHGPKVWISASGAHYYPGDGETYDERGPGGSGFLADVCRQWEVATHPAVAAGIRTVNLRSGMVLARDGGALAQMRLPFRMGLGGPLGSGRQWVSWIGIHDWCRMVSWALQQPEVSGPLNGVSPHPVRQRDFAKCLARQLNRPAVLPAPAFMIRLALGQMGEEMLLSSLRAVPAKAEEKGFHFAAAELEDALAQQLGGARQSS